MIHTKTERTIVPLHRALAPVAQRSGTLARVVKRVTGSFVFEIFHGVES